VRRELPAASLSRLQLLLADSRAWFSEHAARLAGTYGTTYGLPPQLLLRYWDSLVYDLTDDVRAGLLHFLRLAAELGEAPLVQRLER
jgi:predicted solute-binding protein